VRPRSAAPTRPDGSAPGVAVVIPTRNRPGLLRAAIGSVLRGTRRPDEIIVVDQSDASDSTLPELSDDPACPIRYFWTPKPGVSRARNFGATAARYQTIAFIDDDVEVATTWLECLLQEAQPRGPMAIVTGRVLAAGESDVSTFTPSTIADGECRLYEGRINGDVLFTNNAAMPRRVLFQVGAFDERLGMGSRFPNAEDNDLGFRLLEAGFKIVYAPEVVVFHQARQESEYLTLRWRYGKGQGGFYAKHMSLRDRYMLRRLVDRIHGQAGDALRRARHERLLACGNIVYLAGLLAGIGQWLLTVRGGTSRSRQDGPV
jgi:GT2 family glycosyltransferase